MNEHDCATRTPVPVWLTKWKEAAAHDAAPMSETDFVATLLSTMAHALHVARDVLTPDLTLAFNPKERQYRSQESLAYVQNALSQYNAGPDPFRKTAYLLSSEGDDSWECAECGHVVSLRDEGPDKGEMRHCSWCGRRILWTERGGEDE